MTNLSCKKDIKDLTREQLVLWLEQQTIKPFRANQIFKWIYQKQADSFEIMTDLSKEIRSLLLENFSIRRLEKIKAEKSKDGSVKNLFRLKDGNHIETVLIPEKTHYTLCISTQVGCAQGCKFCLTSKAGFVRNLTSGEIIAEVRDQIQEINKTPGDSIKFTNIVFMGMGEPLANYTNVINALNIIADRDMGLSFSNRRITISTAGILPKFLDLARDTKVNLAVSLNAADNKTRSMVMPVNKKYPVEELIKECRKFNLASKRKITFEYILIKGVNDSENDARHLIKLLHPVRAKVNLIPFNENKYTDFLRPDESKIKAFNNILQKNGLVSTVRHSKGQDISAACGQLETFTKYNLTPDSKRQV